MSFRFLNFETGNEHMISKLVQAKASSTSSVNLGILYYLDVLILGAWLLGTIEWIIMYQFVECISFHSCLSLLGMSSDHKKSWATCIELSYVVSQFCKSI